MPLEDTEQSYTLLSMNESDGQTSMSFQRAIMSCDQQDFQITVRHSNIISKLTITAVLKISMNLWLRIRNVAADERLQRYAKYQLHFKGK